MQGMNRRIGDMLDQHPLDSGINQVLVANALALLHECAAVCGLCADACLHEVDVQELRTCIRLNQDCATVCNATAQVLTRRSESTTDTALIEQLRACALTCEACSQECARHAGHMEHCATCAAACRECANAWEQLLDAIQA